MYHELNMTQVGAYHRALDVILSTWNRYAQRWISSIGVLCSKSMSS